MTPKSENETNVLCSEMW